MKDQPDLGARVYNGHIFNVYTRTVDLEDGGSFVQELVSCPDVVRVYPIWDDTHVTLVKEHRHELDRDILRVASGRVEPNETPREAAKRELEEELGLRTDQVSLFAQSTPMLKVRHTVHHFMARELLEVPRQLEPGEIIEPVRVSLRDIDKLVFDDAIREDIVALALLKLVRLLDDRTCVDRQGK